MESVTIGSTGIWLADSVSPVMDYVTQTLNATSLVYDSDMSWRPNILRATAESLISVETDLLTVDNWNTTSTAVAPIENRVVKLLSLLMMIVTCIMIIIGNITVLIVFHYTKALDNATGIFIKSLACADLGVGVCCSFSIHSWFVQEWPYGNISCAMVGYVLAVAVGVSIIGLACLSIDRYIAIKKPLRYCTILTKTKARIIVIAVWAISAGIFMPSLFGWGTFHYNDHSYECSLHWEENVAFSFFIISVLVVPALVTSTFCYAHILKVCFDQTQQIERSEMMFKSAHHCEGSRGKYERLLAKIFLIIISAFYVTWLPFVVTKTLRGIMNINIPPGAVFFFSWLGIVNSFLNCVVYSIGHRSFRVGFFVVLRKIRRSVLSMFSRTSNNFQKKQRRSRLASGHERYIDAQPKHIQIKETSI
ncbi:G-protein coupled receptor 52-like [Diadema antillarum]|uniref:G-protein coupled receptor 52-like n=1 Tax=Diadema antillarum TaxID=105358 RepID=UPI003A8B0446